ncbi:hypothetical protein [Burkholderia sp. BE12]|uniref:hypothetical protein n=1 Tax=Burkholderia sp. BE12 TaxID=2082394 RepID=UPI00131A18DC|nr:hypothetical protein [Burkholderia sp. BE12]
MIDSDYVTSPCTNLNVGTDSAASPTVMAARTAVLLRSSAQTTIDSAQNAPVSRISHQSVA